MKYYFILGNNRLLSIAEIYSHFPQADILWNETGSVAMLETGSFDAKKLIARLGGTIKIGAVEKAASFDYLLPELKKIFLPSTEKIFFGLSDYSEKNLNTKILGMEIKKMLKKRNQPSRLVTGKEKILSSVVVEENNLLKRGFEICLIQSNGRLLIGKTLAVQPFKELSFRDYGRPARDDKSGMLPPKLAQIMINLAQAEAKKTILDPFCGSGTIITESLLMGYQNIMAADISQKAVLDTKKNIDWIAKKFHTNTNVKIYHTDVGALSKIIKPGSVDAVITEPYLGPQRGRIEIKKVVQELEHLYTKALIQFEKILSPAGRIVMVWPLFSANNKPVYINPELNNWKIINPLPSAYQNKNSKRNTLIYSRPTHRIKREIVVIKKR